MVAALLAAGCATYQDRVAPARGAADAGQWAAAAARFEETLARGAGHDRILLLMEAGLCRLYAGQNAAAIALLAEADRQTEEAYTRVLQQAGSLLATDNVIDYRPEPFEASLINTYLALAHAVQGQWPAAGVECRRMHNRLERLQRAMGETTYRLSNPFGSYLSGVLYEQEGRPDEAYIDYKRVAEWTRCAPVMDDLLRLAQRLGFSDDVRRWQEAAGPREMPLSPLGPDRGELVLLIEAGRSPLKIQTSYALAVPDLASRPRQTRSVRVQLGGEPAIEACEIADLDRLAREQLAARRAAILAKQSLVTVGKIVLAQEAGDRADSDLLTFLLLGFFLFTNRADTRSWTSLPGAVYVARAALAPGSYPLTLQLAGLSGAPWQTLDLGTIEIRPWERTVRAVRVLF